MNLLQKIKSNDPISFQEVIAYIDNNYDFTPTAFKNGNQYNETNQNNGSCKVFSFAKLHKLNQDETLQLFGEYYKDVLNTPKAADHQNIRNFMQFGWGGISFEKEALHLK